MYKQKKLTILEQLLMVHYLIPVLRRMINFLQRILGY